MGTRNRHLGGGTFPGGELLGGAVGTSVGTSVGGRAAEGKRGGEATLLVLATVDEVGVVERQLNSAVDDVVDGLDTQHEGVVLVADLVPPAAESATGPDVHILELGQELSEDTLALERGSRVPVVEATVVGGDDLILGEDHLGVDQSLDALLQECLLVNRLHARLGNLKHDGPVGTGLGLTRRRLRTVCVVQSGQLDVILRLVVRRVVGEDGRTVERAVILREVELEGERVQVSSLLRLRQLTMIWTYPALVTDAIGASTADADTNDVGRRVVQALGQRDQVLVAHLLDELINVHGVDELVVADGGAVLQGNGLLLGVHLGDLALGAIPLVLGGESVGDSDPDTAGTISCREAESGIGSPVTGSLVKNDVLGDGLDIGSSDALAEPCALHLSVCVSERTRGTNCRASHTLVVGTAQTLKL